SPLQPLGRSGIDLAARAQGSRDARGVDGRGSEDLERLPPEGREGLRSLLTLLPAGGERVVGLLPLVPVIWSRARSAVTSAGIELGVAAAALLLDVGAFCDVVPLVKRMAIGGRLQCPAMAMALEVQLFPAPRYLKDGRRGCPEQVEAARSVVAGSAHGGPLGKLHLRSPLQRARVMRPRAGLWNFIDDAAIRCEGSASAPEQELSRMAKALKDGMGEQELICSVIKTVLAASHSVLAAHLSDSLAAVGIPRSAADRAVDSGIDAASGRRRVRARASARIAAGARRWRRIAKLRRPTARTTEFRGLRAAGALPQSVYGHQVNDARASWTGAAAATTGWTGLAAGYGRWTWAGAPRAASVWALPAAEGVGERRLAGADDDSFHACAGFSGVLGASRTSGASSGSLRRRICVGATSSTARAPCASAASELRELERESRHAEWGLALAVVSDGQWTRSRRAAVGYVLEQEGCARCGCAVEALVRRIWQCPANVGEVFGSTAAPVLRALAGHGASPAMWLRGVPASCLIAPVFCDQRAGQAAVSFGVGGALEATRREGGFVVVSGDGSGGESPGDPGRMRCANSIVVVGQDEEGLWTELRWFRAVPVPGGRPTVPRAEILGYVLALESVGGNLRCVTDHEPLWRCWERRMAAVQPGGANEDLWQRARLARRRRSPGMIEVGWVPARTGERDHPRPLRAESDLDRALGNAAADAFASATTAACWRLGLAGAEPRTDVVGAGARVLWWRACRALEFAAE
ncbi:unnamed protein product, partial [Prorocentrum cordatum]